MNYEKSIDEFIAQYGDYVFLDAVKLALYKSGNSPIKESTLSEVECKVIDWLSSESEIKLKDFFLSDLSWANNQKERKQALVDFFTKRMGKRVLEILPEDIKNYILAHSL